MGVLKRALNAVKRLFRYRSSVTGRYVPREYAELHPNETQRERVD
jgi:hypothetical protein